jgi:hypothetical protein
VVHIEENYAYGRHFNGATYNLLSLYILDRPDDVNEELPLVGHHDEEVPQLKIKGL